MSKVYRPVVKIPGTTLYVSCDPDMPLTDEITAVTVARQYLENVIPHAVIRVENVATGVRSPVIRLQVAR